MDLQGQTVLITGGSRGIGEITVRTLHQVGAHVLLHYHRGRSEAEAIAADLQGDRIYLLQADLAVPGRARELWSEAWQWRGAIHVLINNAATMPSAPITEDWESWSHGWQQTLQVNLIAVADLCREAVLHFRQQQQGIIINLASRAAFRGDGPQFMPYAASKGGVIALTRTLARTVAAEGILVYAIAPGFVRTARIEELMQTQGAQSVIADIPMGAPADPQDVANLITFLASGQVPHATGATFDINGASYFH
ncbi:MAG: SDR family oxidoreductase [Synechococcaceae cyanobacterium SM2_3_1]|nr:SDR family oxidoreductase [Synechococcaceae cyanobacterium SM2_3_1]